MFALLGTDEVDNWDDEEDAIELFLAGHLKGCFCLASTDRKGLSFEVGSDNGLPESELWWILMTIIEFILL